MAGRVALMMIFGIGCGRSAEPVMPEPSPPSAPALVDQATPTSRKSSRPKYLVGEVCINDALHGPHTFPLFARSDAGWSADESMARAPLTEGPQRFEFLGFDGERHGSMTTAADGVPSDPGGFVGTYYGIGGVGPCGYRISKRKRGVWMDCASAGGCGIAIAVPGQAEPSPTPPVFKVTLVCDVNGSLVMDLDGDEGVEAFPLDGFRGQATVEGTPFTGAPCDTPRFAWYRMPVADGVVDVLGAVDLDRDGNRELMIAYTPAGGQRTVALYTPAPPHAVRLDRRAVVAR